MNVLLPSILHHAGHPLRSLHLKLSACPNEGVMWKSWVEMSIGFLAMTE